MCGEGVSQLVLKVPPQVAGNEMMQKYVVAESLKEAVLVIIS